MAQKTVNTFAELKAAVEDTTTDEVILAADITFENGIKIPTTKKTLSIDGNGHTVTDMNSSSYTDALYIPSAAGSTSVTVENGVWSGRNYYGVICVYDDSASEKAPGTIESPAGRFSIREQETGCQVFQPRSGVIIIHTLRQSYFLK